MGVNPNIEYVQITQKRINALFLGVYAFSLCLRPI